jgi:hypothetical protein
MGKLMDMIVRICYGGIKGNKIIKKYNIMKGEAKA